MADGRGAGERVLNHGNLSPMRTMATPSSLMFPTASQPDIVRANQKDVYYQKILHDQMSSAFRSLFGTRTHMKYQEHLGVASNVAYYGLTLGAGSTTLGEEYCDIMPVYGPKMVDMSRQRRLLLVALYALGPFAFGKAVALSKTLSRRIPHDASFIGRFVHALSSVLPAWQSFGKQYMSSLHLALFYLQGTYYRFADRVLRIRYILMRQLHQNERRIGYEFLGLLIVAQLLVRAYLYQRRKGAQSISDDSVDHDYEDAADPTQGATFAVEPTSQQKCMLCLSMRKHTTATPCGHLFCWNCISEWCRNKPECPLCRQTAPLSHLYIVNNF
ncbi:Pex12 amino terminal region-domain-containing protein [Gaertneriomyces semiglobifer]|nr:Pex12 amino terminal region-domain-containing protein [Gaertneriomyces semiglobifer]